jgi:hypothetical protein
MEVLPEIGQDLCAGETTAGFITAQSFAILVALMTPNRGILRANSQCLPTSRHFSHLTGRRQNEQQLRRFLAIEGSYSLQTGVQKMVAVLMGLLNVSRIERISRLAPRAVWNCLGLRAHMQLIVAQQQFKPLPAIIGYREWID